MKFCKKCVQLDTRPGIKFNQEGVCPACEYIEKAQDVDWNQRKQELLQIITEHNKHKKNKEYDCLIGVSGGKDSTRQAMFVKHELGLKPLLVCCTYPPEQKTERGADNLANLINLGFDTITISPSPKIWKRLMRQGFFKFGNWAKSTEMALFGSVPRIAIAYHIPLILWGDNPAIQFGNLGVGSLKWDGNMMKNTNTLSGGPDAVIEEGMQENEIIWYRYPLEDDMRSANIQLVYLGYFWKDWSKLTNAHFSIVHGLDIREELPIAQGALHPFEALDENFVMVNQMIKYMKYGFGKVADEACELVRAKKITREEALELMKKYDGKCARKFILEFCSYLEITEDQFWQVAESFRNKEIFNKKEDGSWELQYPSLSA